MITEFTNAYAVMRAQITDTLDDDDLAMSIQIYSEKIDTLLILMMELSQKELQTIFDMKEVFLWLRDDLLHKQSKIITRNDERNN